MVRVVLAFGDVGLGVQLQEALEGQGFAVRWDGAAAMAPTGDDDAVIIDGDELAERLGLAASAWRARDPAPGVIAIGSRPTTVALAGAAQVRYVAGDAPPRALAEAIHEVVAMRYASGMTRALARRALALPPMLADATAEDARIIAGARQLDIAIPRAALAWHAQHYVLATDGVARLREARALAIPEVELTNHLDGTRTVQAIVKLGPLDAYQSARLLWALASVGAAVMTPEPADLATPRRRGLAAMRDHLRARIARLESSTFYDVLEVTPLAENDELERAYQLVGRRYAPQMLADLDLADLAGHVPRLWEIATKARAVLVDLPSRGRYNDWVAARRPTLRSAWAIDLAAARAAGDAYARGQRALGEGDVHKALSELATACRHHPGHPEYEANLAWARYRVEVAAGKDRVAIARVERARAEAALRGTRPWPRAQVALALLCAADGDVDAARWQVADALAYDPGLAAAQQLHARLGGR
ncbi:MAG: hypothetical protein K8W52_01860 [Deltaproteobacteria bacterium]|nr:hypothetical protein [Deltaproteobacteria bacterium]